MSIKNDHYAVAFFRFSLANFLVVENQGPLIGSIILDTDGFIEEDISVIIQAFTGTATCT